MKYFEKFKLFILYGLILFLIIIISYTIYNNFIKLAPVVELDDGIQYNNVIYKFIESDFDRSVYESSKCLGKFKNKENSFYQVFTIKNDPDYNYLALEGIMSRYLYIKKK